MSEQTTFRSVWKVARWLILAAAIVAVVLLFKKPSPVADPMPPAVVQQKSEDFQTKMQDLENAHARGETAEARVSADELNAAFQRSATEPPAAANTAATPASPAAPASQLEALPEVKTVQIAFEDDRVTGQFASTLLGKDVYLTISGHIGAKDGYATFEFTEAKIGNMPVPVSLLNARLQEKLQEPETREKLKLPSYVAGLRIENGQLVIVEK